MNQTKFKGNPVNLLGDIPEAGQTAPNFTYVKEDLSEESLYDHTGKIKVIVAVPSLDTGICQLEAIRFNKELGGHADVAGLIVSKDLPFAMKRFCAAEGIENVKIASDFRGNFSEGYKTLMTDGPLKGLSSRVVFVVDKDNKITYTQITDDITVEPNYEEALKAVEKLKG
ncbi:MAG: thiol peroxidase [Granulosicoccus sp.]|jgi:thiol peroxidase